MLLLPSGNVLAAAGYNNNGKLVSAQLYNLTTGTWTTTGSLATARDSFEMVLLHNGNVLAAGGEGNTCCTFVLTSAEVYNSTSSLWTTTGSLAKARENFQLVEF